MPGMIEIATITGQAAEGYDHDIEEEQESAQLQPGAERDFRVEEMKMMENQTCKGRMFWTMYSAWASVEDGTGFLAGISSLCSGVSTMSLCLLSGSTHIVASIAGVAVGAILLVVLAGWAVMVRQAATRKFVDRSSLGYNVVTYGVRTNHALRLCNAVCNIVLIIVCVVLVVYVSTECENREACVRVKDVIRNLGQARNFTGWHLEEGDPL